LNEVQSDRVALALAGPCANYLHLSPDNYVSTLSLTFFTGWMLFLMH